MLPLQSYVWRRVQAGFARFVGATTGLPINATGGTPATPARVVWGTYDIAQVPKPFVSLTRLAAWSNAEPQTYYAERATQQTITVTETTVGEAVAVWLAWAGVRVLVEGGDTLSDTRDRLLAALTTQVEPLNFAASGAADIVVTPKNAQIVNVSALVGCTVTTDVLDVVLVRDVTRNYRIRVQIYGGRGDGDESIDEYADALLTELRTPDGLRSLAQYGLGVISVPETATDATAISGPLQERRLFFDVTLAASSVSYRVDAEAETLAAADPPDVTGFVAPP